MNMFNGLSGKTSIMRVLTAIVVVTTLLVWVAANINCWLHSCATVPMDVQSVGLILGALAAKAGQRAVEKDGNGVKTTNDIPVGKTE